MKIYLRYLDGGVTCLESAQSGREVAMFLLHHSRLL